MHLIVKILESIKTIINIRDDDDDIPALTPLIVKLLSLYSSLVRSIGQ